MAQTSTLDPRQRLHGWRVRGDGVFIDVQADRRDAGRLLAHALGAHTEVTPTHGQADDAPAWTVRLGAREDYDALLVRLRAREPEPEAEDLAPYWRGDFQSLRLGQSQGVQAVAHIDPFVGVTLFEPSTKSLTYLFPAGADVYLPHLEHLVTHGLRVEGWRRGRVDVHAAFVRYRGKGAAIIGPKRAGKTSLAMHLLARGAQLLGSDMAQVLGRGGRLEAFSIPHMCRITRETVWDNGWLNTALADVGEGAASHAEGPLFSHGKYELYDPSMDRVFQRAVALASMDVNALIFPRFDTAVDRQALTPVPPEEGIARLLGSVRHDRPLADWLGFDLEGRTLAEAELEAWTRTSARLPQCFELRFGREASLIWQEIDATFDGLRND